MFKRIVKLVFKDSAINSFVNFVALLYSKYFTLRNRDIIIRHNTPDYIVLFNIFGLNELKLPFHFLPKLIIDGGAYTGISSLYFSKKYPNAKILAIECEDSNFITLIKNIKNKQNIKAIRAGLWNKDTYLKIENINTSKWSFKLKETINEESESIKGVSINTLLNENEFSEIDILKLDIEGSELELFSSNYKSWINKVKVILIELHDGFKPGCTEALYNAIDKKYWDITKSREKTILINKKLLRI